MWVRHSKSIVLCRRDDCRSLQSGLTGNHDTLFAKSLIDGIAAIVMASSLWIKIKLSAGLILVYEGGITPLRTSPMPLLTDSVINEMTCVGSLLIVGLALNMLKLTNLKIMEFMRLLFFFLSFSDILCNDRKKTIPSGRLF